MIAYKFLKRGAVGRFSGYRWMTPTPSSAGEWLSSEGELHLCGKGIHACTTQHLPYWIDDELWIAELEDPVTAEGEMVLSHRGRLLGQIDAWNMISQRAFGEICAWRTRDIAIGALREQELGHAAGKFALCQSLTDLERLTSEVATGDRDLPDHIVGYVADAVQLALNCVPEVAAYVAAHAAGYVAAHGRTKGPDYRFGVVKERRLQALWLNAALNLTHGQ